VTFLRPACRPFPLPSGFSLSSSFFRILYGRRDLRHASNVSFYGGRSAGRAPIRGSSRRFIPSPLLLFLPPGGPVEGVHVRALTRVRVNRVRETETARRRIHGKFATKRQTRSLIKRKFRKRERGERERERERRNSTRVECGLVQCYDASADSRGALRRGLLRPPRPTTRSFKYPDETLPDGWLASASRSSRLRLASIPLLASSLTR